MASSKRRATTISLKKLSSTVDQAIRLAAKRYELVAEAPNVLGRGQILGRMIDKADINEAFAFAESVTASVNQIPGVDASPVVARLGRGILMGFFDRSQTLQQFGE